MGQPLSVIVTARPPEYGTSYTVEKMFDGGSSSYWCSPSGPKFPMSMTFQLQAPALVDGLYFDTKIPGYETSAPKEIWVEVASPQNPVAWFPVGGALVQAGNITQIPFPQPVPATLIRITMNSNHGGGYLAISELRVLGSPMGAQPMMGQPMMGQPPMGQPPMGQPPMGQPPMGQPMMGQPPMGQPMMGQPPMGQPMMGQPMMGQPMMGQPMMGQPPMGAGPSAAYAPGQHVKAQWGGGFYGAKVLQFNGSQYQVAWDDGTAPSWVSPHQVQPDQPAQAAFQAGAAMGYDPGMKAAMAGAAGFMPGQHVMAQWGSGGYYGAKVLQFNGAQVQVAWDDGSAPTWVAVNQVKIG